MGSDVTADSAPRTPFGEKLTSLLDDRGLSLREVARRMQCSAGYLSNVAHGRKRASEYIAIRLDGLLDAGGELAALVEAQARDARPAGNSRGHLPGSFTGNLEGISLSLPYVPGRLVIEISRPDAETSPEPGASLSLVTLRSGQGA